MIVEDKRIGAVIDEDGFNDQFPVGMRVLAVDDDPICLKVLETLLRRCQYHVTITNQAVKALQMLRENRNNYDLVISDVNMPDIDGFKLLELVGLEMDLPVIMLSAHSDTKLVMKGITHGACDYLLKPVRYEELKNIWQHVIRKKKVDPNDQNKSVNQHKAGPGTGEVGEGASSRDPDQNGKANRKRKDQNEDEEEEGEDNEHDSEDPGSQKKPRVVWSVELHRKFVAAVNQLGLDKAVPKKILDLMNVEGLTRENVASHLQKYRLYLKRISNAASQQANMVAAFGSKDSSYLRMGSLDGFNDFRSLAGPGRFSSPSLSSYPPGGMLGRLNSPATLTLRGITSSGMVQPGPSQNYSSSINSLAKFQSVSLPANQSTSLFQGIPTSLELKQLQQSKGIYTTSDFSPIENSNAFTAFSSIPDAGVGLGSSSNTMNTTPSNSLLLQGNPEQAQSRTILCNESSLSMASPNPDSFDIGASGSSNFLDHGRCHDSWQNAVKFPSNPLLNEQLPLNNLRENASSGNPVDFSSSTSHSRAAGCSRNMESQAGLIGNFVQNMSYTPEQRWEEQKRHYNQNLSHNYSTVDPLSSANGISDSLRQSMGQNNAICIENIGMPINSQLNGGASVPQQGDIDRSIIDGKMRSDANYMLVQSKSQSGFVQNGYDCLDDLMNTMAKRVSVTQEQNDAMLMDGELGFDGYSLGSCM